MADDGGVKRRLVAGQHLRASGGREVARDKDVFVRQRHAFKRASVASGQAGVGSGGLGQGGVGVQRDVGTQVGVLVGAGKKILRGFGGADVALAQGGGQCG